MAVITHVRSMVPWAGGMLVRELSQSLIVAAAMPYIRAELPGWGRLLRLVAGWRRDRLWDGAASRTITTKLYGHTLSLNMRKWTDRSTFFLGRWYDLETQTALWSLVHPGDLVVDIGANRGLFSLAASAAVGPRGRVIAIEPNPAEASILKRDLERNMIANVKVIGVGLSDREGIMTLHVPAGNSGEASFGMLPYPDEFAIDVPVKVGDRLLDKEHPSLIKIDVEGFEVRVLRGLEETLKRARPIVITEMIERQLVQCGSNRAEMIELMRKFGYQGFGMVLKREGLQHALQLTEDLTCRFNDMVWLPDEHAQLLRREFRAMFRANRLELELS